MYRSFAFLLNLVSLKMSRNVQYFLFFSLPLIKKKEKKYDCAFRDILGITLNLFFIKGREKKKKDITVRDVSCSVFLETYIIY